jgi:hypothetical protein
MDAADTTVTAIVSPAWSPPGQAPDVAGAGLVLDDPHHHEQGGLEQPVRQDQRAPGDECRPGPEAQQHHHEPELAHGAEGEQPLEVVLA